MFVLDPVLRSVSELLQGGMTHGEISRTLRFDRAARRTDGRVHATNARESVKWLLAQGFKRAEVARILSLSKPTITYYAATSGAHIDERFSRRYDWAAIREFYEQGHSRNECQRRFGFSNAAWANAVGRGAIDPRPALIPIEELLSKTRNRRHLKLRLLAAGLLTPRCAECGISDWLGRSLSLELHHKNGDGKDNRLENLTLLCPNCHSQTDTWGGRNKRLRLVGDADRPSAGSAG